MLYLYQNYKFCKQTRKLLYYHAKVGSFRDSIRVLRDSIILPQSPSYQRRTKHKKVGPTTHRDEPHQALKPLILSHSSILSPVSSKNPMASFGNCRLCRCEIMTTFTPGVNHLPLLPHLILLFDKSTNYAFANKSPCFCAESSIE